MKQLRMEPHTQGLFTCDEAAVARSAPPARFNGMIRGAGAQQLAVELRPSVVPESRRIAVFVHGFCGNRQENGLFEALADECAARGIHAVLYDWRGLGDSEGDFKETSLDDHVDDFRHVLRWCRTLADDVESLSAVGFSLGAAIIGSVLREESPLDSVAYLSPAVRPRLSMWPRYDKPEIHRELDAHGCVKKPDSDVVLGRRILASLETTDLGRSAFALQVPLLVCHGSADTRIDCSHTRELVEAVPRRAVEYREFRGASHSFRPDDRHWKRLSSVVGGWLTGMRRSRGFPLRSARLR
jgi:uncharacterized protein